MDTSQVNQNRSQFDVLNNLEENPSPLEDGTAPRQDVSGTQPMDISISESIVEFSNNKTSQKPKQAKKRKDEASTHCIRKTMTILKANNGQKKGGKNPQDKASSHTVVTSKSASIKNIPNQNTQSLPLKRGESSETIMHAIRDCKWTKAVWNLLVHDRFKHKFFNNNIHEWMEENLTVNRGYNGGNNWSSIFAIGSWLCWKQSNEEIFNKKTTDVNSLVHQILNQVQQYEKAVATSNFVNGGIPLINEDNCCWKAPNEDGFKVMLTVLVGLKRVLVAVVVLLEILKVIGLLVSLRSWAKARVSKRRFGVFSWDCILLGIKTLRKILWSRDWDVDIAFVPREANSATDLMAKLLPLRRLVVVPRELIVVNSSLFLVKQRLPFKTQEIEKGGPVSRGDVWTVTHKRRDGSFVNDEARLISVPDEGSGQPSPEVASRSTPSLNND
ncbi:ribonuclease H [Senna tora]|uniref:Ribonuclease H n=1 Tax=Senna tora TaxID=362788 RepID=A0A834XEH4_9FABA|nr:ribonuclease H [Senna tora]